MNEGNEECRTFTAGGTCYDNTLGGCGCWCHTKEGEGI